MPKLSNEGSDLGDWIKSAWIQGATCKQVQYKG